MLAGTRQDSLPHGGAISPCPGDAHGAGLLHCEPVLHTQKHIKESQEWALTPSPCMASWAECGPEHMVIGAKAPPWVFLPGPGTKWAQEAHSILHPGDSEAARAAKKIVARARSAAAPVSLASALGAKQSRRRQWLVQVRAGLS